MFFSKKTHVISQKVLLKTSYFISSEKKKSFEEKVSITNNVYYSLEFLNEIKFY